MNKTLFCTVVLFLVIAVSAFAGRGEIDSVTQAYEAIVVEAENVAQRPLIAPEDFTALDEKATAAGTSIQAVESERAWTIQDAKNLVALNVRFNQAMTAIAKKLVQY
jgi:hypothetical protein